MRNILLLTTALTINAAASAVAQEAPYSQTLDEQMQRVAEGKAAVPIATNRPADAIFAPSAGSMIDSVGSNAIPSLPLQIMTTGSGVKYITGGVGEEEVTQIKASRDDYNVRLLLTAQQGEYLSYVQLRVQDDKGAEILTTEGGPYFYARMQPGIYTLTATTQQGQSKTIKIRVLGQGVVRQQLSFAEAGGITTVHQPTAKID